jgi:hypothetical protein
MAERLLVVAALTSADALAGAFDAAWRAGHQRLEALSSHPLPGLRDPSRPRRLTGELGVGVVVAGIAFLIQYYAAAWAYPMDVAGKPAQAWAPLVPAALVLGLMGAGIAALVSMVREAALPRLHHPVFDASRLDLGDEQCYILAIEVKESELPQLRPWLEGLGAEEIQEVRP